MRRLFLGTMTLALAVAMLFVGPTTSPVLANPLDELAKLDPFRPQTQIETDSVPGNSGLWFRNQTDETIFVAIDHHVSGSNSISVGDYNLPVVQPDGWMVIGWFEVPPHKMIQVLSGDLGSRYYYYYAKSKSFLWEGGKKKFIHPTDKFSYDSSDPKATAGFGKLGYIVRGFRQIDTQNSTGFTMNLK